MTNGQITQVDRMASIVYHVCLLDGNNRRMRDREKPDEQMRENRMVRTTASQ